MHDFLLDVRGGERVFLELCDMWPEADLFTAVYDEVGTEGRFANRRLHSSFLQRLRPSARNFRALLPLYPAAIESFDLAGYDLIVSSSSAWAHGVLCSEDAVHVCYCHSPFRYAWSHREHTLANCHNPITRALLRRTFERWREWDRAAASRPTRYIANSRTTQARIHKYFGREAEVVHPPVDCSRFSPMPVGDHYLIVSELMAHKQIDVAIMAFNRLRLPLVVVGDGPEYRRLRRLAGPTVTFTGRLADEDVASLMATCRALVVTSVEEFGLAAVECQAAGRPVIARARGGALETIVDGRTGTFYSGGPGDLAVCVLQFDDERIDPQACIENARQFDTSMFRRRIHEEIQAARAERRAGVPRASRPLVASRLARRATREVHN